MKETPKQLVPSVELPKALQKTPENLSLTEKEDEDNSFMKRLLEARKNRKAEEEAEKPKEQLEGNSDLEETKVIPVINEIGYLETKDEKVGEEETVKESNTDYNYDEMYEKTFGTRPYKHIEKSNVTTIFENIPKFQKPEYKIVGIVFKTYIVIEMNDEMYVIDQHAAHERILYEKVKKNYYSDGVKESQLMLLPDIITLTHKEMEIAKENFDTFEKAGFMVEEFGENTIKLSGVPEMCIDLETKEMFLETLDEIMTLGRTAKQEIEERFIATVSCKAAVKANMALDEKEVKSLMDELLELPNPFTCPHGRPTSIKMTKYEIERKFARK